MIERLVSRWVYGGFLAGFVLLALLAIVARDLSLPMIIVTLQLPLYMFHQYEEHDDDRFRQYVNKHVGGGEEVLSIPAVFVINIGGVWVLNLVSIALAATVDLGFGMIGTYGALVNSLVHIAGGVAERSYNPGLLTAVVLLLPAGVAGVWIITFAGHGSWGFQTLGLGVATILHLAIIAYVVIVRHRRRGSG